MKIQNTTSRNKTTNPNFDGHIRISRINNDPNSQKIEQEIYKTVDSFSKLANDFKCELFIGTHINPKTKARKIVIATDNDYLYCKRYGIDRFEQKMEELDLPLLELIRNIKRNLQTPNVKNACLIDSACDSTSVTPRLERVIQKGKVDYKVTGAEAAIPIKKENGSIGYRVYNFIKKENGAYISTQELKKKDLVFG